METFPLGDLVQLFIVELLRVAIPVAAAWFGYQLAVLVKAGVSLIKSRTDEQRFAQLQGIVEVLIKAAEQSGLKNGLLRTGTEKKQWVLGQLNLEVQKRGWTHIDTNMLSALIESSLLDGLHKGGFLVEVPVQGQ